MYKSHLINSSFQIFIPYFIHNDKTTTDKGYTEITEVAYREYISTRPDNHKPYFINLEYARMEVTEAEYRSFYKGERREMYISEANARIGVVSFNALDTEDGLGEEIVADKSVSVDESAVDNVMLSDFKKVLPELLAQFDENDRELIELHFFKNVSQVKIAETYGVKQQAIKKN